MYLYPAQESCVSVSICSAAWLPCVRVTFAYDHDLPLHELMSPAYEIEAIDVIKLIDDLVAKQVARACGDCPHTNILRVAPYESNKAPLVVFLEPVQRPYLVKRP